MFTNMDYFYQENVVCIYNNKPNTIWSARVV